MKKGTSTAIVMILVMLITISLILMTYQWLLKYSPQTQQNLENSLPQDEGCLKIENINTNQITVRNCGDISLSNFIVYLDSVPIATYSGVLNPGSIIQISTGVINGGNHEIFVSSSYAESPTIIFNVISPPLPCDFYIYQNNMTDTYFITQNNKFYCLAENINISGKNAINFSSGVQNTILDCQGYSIHGNDSSSAYGVYLLGAGTNGNTVKNCNITDFYYGIDLSNGPSNNTIANNIVYNNINFGILLGNLCNNNTIANNTANSSSYPSYGCGIGLATSNNNILTNNTANNNAGYGILVNANSNNNILTNNTANNNAGSLSGYGIFIYINSNNNVLTNNTAKYNNYGILLQSSSNNNTLINNMLNSNTQSGIWIWSSYNNSVTGGSIFNNTNYDYYLQSAGINNSFTNTNFTTARNISFYDTTSWFNYQNDTSQNVWLNTNVSATTTITRKLTYWSQYLIEWNDTSGSITARYNITGLTPNTNYSVYNNSVLLSGSPFLSSSSGQINFTIYLPANQEHDIKVVKWPCQVFINFLPYNITLNNTYYCLNTNSVNLAKTAIQFGNSSSWAIQNSTLDCQAYNLNGNKTAITYGVYLTGNSAKGNAVKYCNITNFTYGVYLFNGTNNNTLYNNTANNNTDGFNITTSFNNTLFNNTANYNSADGFYIVGGDGVVLVGNTTNNTLYNNTANYNSADGFYLLFSYYNNLTGNIAIYNSYYGIHTYACNWNTINFNTARWNAGGMNIFNSSYNTMYNNTASGNSQIGIDLTGIGSLYSTNNIISNTDFSGAFYGVEFDYANNNTLYNIRLVGCQYGIYFSGARSYSYNNITVGQVNSNNVNDYYLNSLGATNNFSSIFPYGITANIHFGDSGSWFNWNDYNIPVYTPSNIWLDTSVSAAATISRSVSNWNQTLIQWSDTPDSAVTATYNITGLLTNTNYNVYNNSFLVYTINSGSNGNISFTINTPGNIMVAKSSFNGVLWFTFDEGSGNKTYDSSSYGNNGTLGDGNCPGSGKCPTWQSGSNCTYGNCLSFDGANDYVNVSDSNSLDVSNITITAWIYPLSWGGNSMGRIEEKNNAYMFYVYGSSSHLSFYYYNNSGIANQSFSSPNSIQLNTWQFVAVTYNGTHSTFYVNGIFNGTTAHPLAPGPIRATTDNLYIGYNGTYHDANTRAFNGTIDDLRIWNRSLSQAEIQAVMSGG